MGGDTYMYTHDSFLVLKWYIHLKLQIKGPNTRSSLKNNTFKRMGEKNQLNGQVFFFLICLNFR